MNLKKNIPKCVHVTLSAIKNPERQNVMNRIYANLVDEKIDSLPILNDKKIEIINKIIFLYKNQ